MVNRASRQYEYIWSPDGRWITYVDHTRLSFVRVQNLVLMDTESGLISEAVVFDPDPRSDSYGMVIDAVFSADSSTLYYLSYQRDGDVNGYFLSGYDLRSGMSFRCFDMQQILSAGPKYNVHSLFLMEDGSLGMVIEGERSAYTYMAVIWEGASGWSGQTMRMTPDGSRAYRTEYANGQGFALTGYGMDAGVPEGQHAFCGLQVFSAADLSTLGQLWVIRDGELVCIPFSNQADVEAQLTQAGENMFHAALSPDGSKVLVSTLSRRVYLVQLSTMTMEEVSVAEDLTAALFLTKGPSPYANPLLYWFPDFLTIGGKVNALLMN